MEAKDTVMSHNEVETTIKNCYRGLIDRTIDGEYYPARWHRELQAEISFKAGIREVVEWASKFAPTVHKGNTYQDKVMPDMTFGWRWQCDDDCPVCIWQAKLKEWGL